jgi:AsmA protein
MKGIVKIIVGIFVVLLLAIVAVMAVAVFVFDPDDYREVVAGLVQDQTGRTLEIDGGLSINVLPCCSVSLKDTRLSNPPGFDEPEFAQVESVKLGLRLWPLIVRQEILVDDISLDGLRLSLIQRADGVANWTFESEPAPGEEQTQEADGEIDLSTLSIGGIRIRDAQVSYEDAEAAYRLEDFEMQTGRIAVGEPVGLEMSLRAEDLKAGTQVQVNLDGEINIDPEFSQFVLSELDTQVNVNGGDLPADAIDLALTADSLEYDVNAAKAKLKKIKAKVDLSGGDLPADTVALTLNANAANYDVNAERAKLKKLRGNVDLAGGELPAGGVKLAIGADSVTYMLQNGRAELEQLDANVDAAGLQAKLTGNGSYSETRADLAGEIKVDSFSPRELLATLDQPEVVTADPAVLQAMDIDGQWSVMDSVFQINGMDLRLDDTKVQGTAQLNYVDQSDIQFDITVDEINLDRYLPPVSDEPVASDDTESGPDELPVEMFKDLELQGRARVGAVTVNKTLLQNIEVTINATDGRLKLDPIAADLYGGRYKGKMTLNVERERPRMRFQHSLKAVQIGGLFGDMMEMDNVEGLLTASFNGAGFARNSDEMLRTMDADLSVDLAEGIYKGLDVWYEIRKARALLKGEPPPQASADPKTAITAMDLTGKIDKGQFASDKLLVEIPFIRIDGRGTANLVKGDMDYRLNARVFGEPEFADGEDLSDLTKFVIPLTISGDMASPKIGVDLANLAKDVAVQKVQDKLFDKLGLEKSQDKTTDGPADDAVKKDPKEELLKEGLRSIFD